MHFKMDLSKPPITESKIIKEIKVEKQEQKKGPNTRADSLQTFKMS